MEIVENPGCFALRFYDFDDRLFATIWLGGGVVFFFCFGFFFLIFGYYFFFTTQTFSLAMIR